MQPWCAKTLKKKQQKKHLTDSVCLSTDLDIIGIL